MHSLPEWQQIQQRANRSPKRELRSSRGRLEFLQPFTDHFIIGH